MSLLLLLAVLVAAEAANVVHTSVPHGYIVNKEVGKAYRVVYHAQTWNRAKMDCETHGASLAVPKSQDEFHFLQRLVRGMYYPQVTETRYKLLVWLGISNIEDYNVWTNIDDEDIETTGFHKWASNNVNFSNDPMEPHCAGMDGVNPGLRDYWCHLRQPYICQIKVESYGQPNYNNLNEVLEHSLD
ncbi:CD209 antigen-like protein 2 [Helicoverpa zea]|uniref:CD209 antigen-like protein 2 n=1 Tax=Helicoverpa zea TaxID=7113 RepID=UPI001F5ACE79|nr:CD209 antigen-like protein 2 [Helicoverpa zea]